MSAPYPPPGDPNKPPPPSGKQQIKLSPRQIVGAVVIVLALIFIFENTGRVGVRIIIPKFHAPLFVALLISAALGSLGTLLVQWRRRDRGERGHRDD